MEPYQPRWIHPIPSLLGSLYAVSRYLRCYVCRAVFGAIFAAVALMGALSPGFAQSEGPVAGWTFDGVSGSVLRDPVTGIEDKVGGLYQAVPGVSGNALRFD